LAYMTAALNEAALVLPRLCCPTAEARATVAGINIVEVEENPVLESLAGTP